MSGNFDRKASASKARFGTMIDMWRPRGCVQALGSSTAATGKGKLLLTAGGRSAGFLVWISAGRHLRKARTWDGLFDVNGAFVDESDAQVSIFDRGYLFGDGAYEVVPVCGGRLIDRAPFIARLGRSLGELQIAWPCTPEDYIAFHDELIRRNHLAEGMIYSQVTRGVADRDFAFPRGVKPAVVAFTQAKAIIANPLAETGVRVVTVEDIRWKRRDIKAIALLGQVLAKQQAAEAGAFEGWMVEDGLITEGTSSTAYIVKDGWS